jgi:signal transduction histidine kinase
MTQPKTSNAPAASLARWGAWVLAVAAIHVVAVRVGVLLDVWPADGESVWLPFWLPAGTALASLLLLGWRYWPGVLIGSVIGDLSLGLPFATAAILGAGNAAEAVVSTVLIRRFVGSRRMMATVAGFMRLVAVVAGSAALISAPLGVWALVDIGFMAPDEFWHRWWLWTSGNVVGVLVAAPAPLALLRRTWRHADFGNKGEALAVIGLASLVAGAVHSGWPFPVGEAYPLAFTVLPFVIWVAFRFGPEGTSLLVPALSVIATVGVAAGDSPFVRDTAFETLSLLQAYIGISAVSAFLLSALVSERNSMERALRAAKDEAERANKAKSDFLANMSHELRTPLNAIIGFSETIERETFGSTGNPRYRDYAAHIHGAGHHLLTLINGMLDLYRVESGGVEVQKSAVDVAALVDELATFGRVLAQRENNGFAASAQDGIGEVNVDPTLIRQILFNLLGNAAKYTEGGEIRLHAARRQIDGRDWLEFTVSDTGAGMTEEEQARIFEPFDRGNPMLAGHHEGFGLGLTITAHLCALLGGEIKVESRLGEGTTFTVRVPAGG